jgi:glutamine amidotransferase
MNVALFDYGTGNLHSLKKALEAGGARVLITSDVRAVGAADALVLPGVGAFSAAAAQLEDRRDALCLQITAGLPTLGICLGMQLLFESSEEGDGRGLGVLGGRVRRLRARRLPQMGWNEVVTGDDALFAGAERLSAYYANTFVAEPTNQRTILAWSEYGAERFPAAVRHNNVVGMQFHPEKSGRAGLCTIANFLKGART